MPERTRKSKQTVKADERMRVGIQIDSYDVAIETSVNSDAFHPQYSWNLDEDAPLYPIRARLYLRGASVYPDERVGDRYEITICGKDSQSRSLNMKLSDIQARDKFGARRYQSYRGRDIPIFEPPKGLCTVEKQRGEGIWRLWIFERCAFVAQALAVLRHHSSCFVALDAHKVERHWWIRSFSVQTLHPEIE